MARNIVMNWESWMIHSADCAGSRKQYNEANKGCPKSLRNYPTYEDAIDTLTVESREEALAYIDECGDYLFESSDEEKNALFDRCLSDLPQSATESEEDDVEDEEEEWDEEEDMEGVGYYGPIEAKGRPKEWSKFFDTSFEVVDSALSEIQFRVNKTVDGERPFGHVVIIMGDDSNEVDFESSNMTEKQIDALIKKFGEKKFFGYLGNVADAWFDIEDKIFEEMSYDA